MSADDGIVTIEQDALVPLTPGEPVGPAEIVQAIRATPRGPFLRSGPAAGDIDARHAANRARGSSPVVRKVLDALELGSEGRVLEVGTGDGYLTALLGRLCARVFSVERLDSVAQAALQRFVALDLKNIRVKVGDGFAGWPEEAPFDAILVSARVAYVPPVLLRQLRIGGHLVAPIGASRVRQTLTRITRVDEHEFMEEALGEVRFLSRLGDILVELGAATRAQVEDAARVSQETGVLMRAVLMERHGVHEPDIWRALALQHGLRFASIEDLLRTADTALHRRVSRAFLEGRHVVPLTLKEGVLTVASAVPESSPRDVAAAFNARVIESYLVTPTDFRRLWVALDLGRSGPATVIARRDPDEDLLHKAAEKDSLFVDLVEAILLEAIGNRASDVHLERYPSRTRVRVRVDGVLHDVPRFALDEAEHRGVINVLKIWSDLDITERRLPQAGRIRRRAGDATFDMRVQVQPGLHGESAVVRLLEEEGGVRPVDALGFPEDVARSFVRLLGSPAGMVLVVGPTGSGKTTTLYAGLKVLAADRSRKVITIEDPVEYAIDGVQQVPVRREVGFGYAEAVRAFLHEDPDVILLGEIHDEDTALQAVRASQTGHVLLSTAHSNDATDAVQRLLDLGLHPNSVASELAAIFAQRLARRICEGCKAPATPDPALLAELFGAEVPADFRCFAGEGCERCQGRGTLGRVPVVEMLIVNDRLRRAISHRVPVDELRARARAQGMITARERALTLVRSGMIPLAELPRVLTPERMAER
ncbi:MAG: Flp pilus assembly complex ATPase component TadA [Alphaproteobacteria bacterium]|nr:Flp pilus assembly complex ATPase component TadA [Alphaproteobacteria bacterium]